MNFSLTCLSAVIFMMVIARTAYAEEEGVISNNSDSSSEEEGDNSDSSSEEEGVLCNNSDSKCPEKEFCNYDNGGCGFCESCINFPFGNYCYDDGLPQAGADECDFICSQSPNDVATEFPSKAQKKSKSPKGIKKKGLKSRKSKKL